MQSQSMMFLQRDRVTLV